MAQTIEASLEELKRRLIEISDLERAASVLDWDHATYMPSGGAEARGRQGATLGRLAHEKSVDPALGRLLDALMPHADGLPPDSDTASLIRVARRDFEKAIRVPAEYVARARGGLGLLRCLDPGEAGERLRRHAAAPGADARAQPRIRGLLRTP